MPTKDLSEDPTVTVMQVVKRLKIGRSTVYDMFDKGEIKSVRIRRARRTSWAWVQEYLDTHPGHKTEE